MPATEFDIIEQVFKRGALQGKSVICGIGDDAAVLELPPNQQLVVSTDTLVSDVHYFHDADPFDIGYKSLAVNLSDMAAMAAEPLWVTLCLTLPANDPVWIQKFADGFFTLANKYGVSLVGGDLTHGPLSISIQIMGAVPHDTALKRSEAKPGELVYVTGKLGMAALALAILKGEAGMFDVPPGACLDKLNRPEPRLDIGTAIRDIAGAAIDISDGLAADLGHVLKASSVGAEIELGKIPVYEELSKLDEVAMWHCALSGGDDYELCFTAHERHQNTLKQISQDIACPINCIGKITPGDRIKWMSPEGENKDIPASGYRHF